MSAAPKQAEKEAFRTVKWRGLCPHCGERIAFRVKTDLGTFGLDTPDADWLDSISDQDREVLALAQSSGVFDSFAQAARDLGPFPLANTSKSFLKFLGSMRPNPAPALVLGEFPNSRAVVYSSGAISAIAVDGDLRMFVPTARIFLKKPKVAAAETIAANGKLQVNTIKVKELTAEMNQFHDWVKTRMGYVPREGQVFLKEMRKRSYGAFGTHEKAKPAGAGHL